MYENTAREMAKQIAQSHEECLREQLAELISRNLLVAEFGPWQLVSDQSNPHMFSFRQKVNLKLKDQEYIEKLERENKEMREIIERICKYV